MIDIDIFAKLPQPDIIVVNAMVGTCRHFSKPERSLVLLDKIPHFVQQCRLLLK